MSNVRLAYVGPLAEVWLPMTGHVLQQGDVFEVPSHVAGRPPKGDDLGAGLLAQVGNYERAKGKSAADVVDPSTTAVVTPEDFGLFPADPAPSDTSDKE